MGQTPTREPQRRPAPTEPPAARQYHENGVHQWSEVEGDERRGYTTTCEDCGLPAWGGSPALAMTRAQQMDRRRIEWARQPSGARRTVVEELLRHLDPPDVELPQVDEIDLSPPVGREHDVGLGRGL